MKTFQQFLEAQRYMGLKAPSVLGQVGKAVAKTALGFLPVVGGFTDLAYGLYDIIKARKEGKQIKPLLLKMMNIQDQMRQPGTNLFDIDDVLSDNISNVAKSKIADMMIQELERVQYNPQQIPPNFANMIAAKYLMSLVQQYQT